MDEILVSICSLVYNHAPYLRQCLDSLVNQKTDFKYEILIHDDASNDGSQEIIKEYEDKYPDLIKPIYQTENQYSKHVTVEYTYLYPRIKGKFVAFCEGDDCWVDPYKLQKQVQILQENSNITLCTHIAEKIKDNGVRTGLLIKPNTWNGGIIKGNEFIKKMLQGVESYPFHTATFLVRKEILIKDYLFRLKMGVGDVPIMLISALNGDIYFIEESMSYRRINVPGSYNDRLSSKKFAISCVEKKIAGYESFDEETNFLYHEDLIHNLTYLKAQIAYAKKDVTKESRKEFKKVLSRKELMTAYLKFSVIGNFLRVLHIKYIRNNK